MFNQKLNQENESGDLRAASEALAEGINTGHADMPAFELSPDQIHDLLSYLKTLE